VNLVELAVYVSIATVATYWARVHLIAHDLLEALLLRDPSALQQTALCLAVWLAYLGSILLVFFQDAQKVRCCDTTYVVAWNVAVMVFY
jgi:hypothetical protein